MGNLRYRKRKKNRAQQEKQRKHPRSEGEQSTTEQPGRNYVELVRENKDFEKYYMVQNLVPNNEWEDFMKALKTDLPAALRITGSMNQAKALAYVMKEKYFKPLSQLEEVNVEGEEPIKPLKPVCLSWYPDGLAWQLNLTRRNIKKSEAYWKLHQFLISETESGNISRQESVSMIPPIVLDVKPHHKVLDMCAAPGSKTAQLIEFLHNSTDERESVIPSGVIVANDADNKRCYMLTHQVNRLQSPSIMVTNHDAAFMPNINHTRKDGSTGPIKFDRILCDVPCSGDGTLRKNYDVWTKWNHINGANLHGLQFRIARRALEMLAVGGKMVYSTCSMNPLENEAVISRLIQEYPFSIQVCDVKPSQLPGLKVKQGMTSWAVLDRQMNQINNADDIPVSETNMFHKHLFPPTGAMKPGIQEFLQKCIRIQPHHQDTGGFFVAVIEKIKPLQGEKVYVEKTEGEQQQQQQKEDEEQIGATGDNTQTKHNERKKVRRGFGFKEEPYFYLEKDDEMWGPINNFYKFKEFVNHNQFLTRTNEGRRKTLYFTNSLAKDIVTLNQERIKIINTGVKALVRSDNKGTVCDFRLAQDGSQVMLSLITERIIKVTRDDLEKLLQNNDMEAPPEISTLDPITQESIKNMDSGSAAFIYTGPTGLTSDQNVTIGIVGWKGQQSVRGYVAKNDRLHYLRLIDGDLSKYHINKFEQQRASSQASTETENGEDTLVSKDE